MTPSPHPTLAAGRYTLTCGCGATSSTPADVGRTTAKDAK
jgi:hypothetical protein